MDVACWCLRGHRAPQGAPVGPPPPLSRECVFVQPKRIPSDAYLPALLEREENGNNRNSRTSPSYGFSSDSHRQPPYSLRLQQERRLQRDQQSLNGHRRRARPVASPFIRPVRHLPPSKQYLPFIRDVRGYYRPPPVLPARGQPFRFAHTAVREAVRPPLATSTPRHARARLGDRSENVPRIERLYPPESRVFHRPPVPPNLRRKTKRNAKNRESSRLARPSKLPTPPRVVRDDGSSDFSVVSPMPSLDVSYTAYLTPEVLTPAVVVHHPSTFEGKLSHPQRKPRPRTDDYWVDEFGEAFVQHNPLYSPDDDDLPELTLSTYPSTSPPTPPFIHASNVFQRLQTVRRRLEQSDSSKSIFDKQLYLPLPTSPAQDSPIPDSLVDSDYGTPDHFSDDSKLSPRPNTASVGTQTPDYPRFEYLIPQRDTNKSSGDSSTGSSPSRSPVVPRSSKHRMRSHKSSRRRRQRKIQQPITPLSPIAENNGINGLNGLSTPAIISTITTAITSSSREIIQSLPFSVENVVSPSSSSVSLPSTSSFAAKQVTVSTHDPRCPLVSSSSLSYDVYSAPAGPSSRPHGTAAVASVRQKILATPISRPHHGRNGARPHRKRLRRKRKSSALSREFLFVRMFDIKEDARFVYIILVLIQMFLRFEQVGVSTVVM